MVCIDAQLTVGTATGIGEYLRGLLVAFERLGTRYIAAREPRLDPWRFDRRLLWDQGLLPLHALRGELLHCAAGTVPFLLRTPYIVTVHDVAWLRVQGHTKWYARAYFGAAMMRRYRSARRIIVDSAFSCDELLALGAFAAERVDVVHPGVADDFMRVVREAPSPLEHRPPVILAVGTIEERKNLTVVIRALASMRNRDAQLVAVGPATPYLQTCLELARRLGVAERFIVRGYLSREELLKAYATAAVAVLPSRYEGFGYGAAQALVAGVPLVAARTSSLPEVVLEDAPLLDPDDEQAWAQRLDETLTDRVASDARAQVVRHAAAQRFAWESAAQKTIASYAAAQI